MSAVALVSFRTPALAWTDSKEDERLFKRVTNTVLLVTVAVCLALLLSPAAKPDRTQAEPLPAPMAKLLLENANPPPVPELPQAKLQPKPQTEPDAAAPAPKDKPEPVKSEPAPQRAPANEVVQTTQVPDARVVAENKAAAVADAARRRVASMGLLAAKDDIAQVRGSSVAVPIKNDIRQSSGSGSGGEVALATRSLVTAGGATSSGGSGAASVNIAAAGKAVSSGGLAGRATTVVEAATPRAGAGDGAKRSKATRSIEDIRLVFARNMGALNAIITRAQREDPTLQGKVLVELKIAPTGEVLSCRVVSSDLHAPELEAKLLSRIRQFDFGAKDVEVMVVSQPVDVTP